MDCNTPQPTPRPRDRVPFIQKLAYGLGGPVEHTAVWIPQANLTPVFNIAMGLNPALIGVVLMVWRLYDAITDPVMGNISDNARTRWGRRRPFIVLGAVLTGMTMPLIWWMPTGMSQLGMTAWLIGCGMAFYTCFSIWAMPYYSLQLEMTPDYNERTSISAYRAFPQQICSAAAGWVLALAALPMFGQTATGSPDLANGMRTVSIGLAAVTILFGVLPGIFVRERYYAKEASKQAKQPLLAGMKLTLTTPPFLWIVAIAFTKTFGFGLVASLGFYLNAYYACKGDIALATTIAGVIATSLVLPNLIAVPLCTAIANHWEKKTLLYVTVLVGMSGSFSVYFFVTPSNPWLQIIPALLIFPLGVGLWLVVPSMQADVADYDELRTGQRREGSFSAVFSWTFKLSTALTNGLGGLLLVWTGFQVSRGAAQPPEVLAHLKTLYVWIPIGFWSLCLLCIWRYPLTRQRMEEIRAALEARRGSV